MKQKNYFFILLFLSLFASACTTSQKPSQTGDRPVIQEPIGTRADKTEVEPKEPVIEQVDPEEVARALKINTALLPRGSKEYRVNLCKLGLTKRDCTQKRFTVLKYRILCRDSEGTVEYVSEYDYQALAGQEVEWRVLGNRGRSITDSEGEAIAYILTNQSPRYKQIAFVHGKYSLGLRVNQVRQIVVPRYWCD